MNCPACHAPLILIEFRRVEIDYCAGCGGVWLDAGELEMILGLSTASLASAAAEVGRSHRPCPRCDRRMREISFARASVTADACPATHGFWLDRGELEAIIASEAARERVGELASLCQELFGANRTKEQGKEPS
jgi:Zn-finger nucleic acid-binding protein